ncbi:unnamed protein product [Peronospora belbahrii]|uniref:H/ACA ribonucleoprotein complex non-core subunit NAF1 n=1 Tax=Peronospora belbahrii TaxID=622444 RepID=A0AAU9L7I4_9STRA|nr:unnamed protein product [Peronospora belbahrii]
MIAPLVSEPVSDLAVAAQYADAELHSVTAQFENSTSMSEAPKMPMVAVLIDDKEDDSDSDSSEDEADMKQQTVEINKSVTEDVDESSSDEVGEDTAKLRAEIKAVMTKQDNVINGPLTTEHEVVVAPVREPDVELTKTCPIVHCGNILNVSVPGLMMTIKSNPNSRPLDEGSVLCLEDRTVIGCINEIFGPVLMPMYLIRFENASKMPEKAAVNVAVYYATEHTTYIIPENIKDKGTDASNLFDEETDETEFSDDEAEAASKRGNGKRNRGGAHSTAGDNAGFIPSYSGRGGHGRRGGRGGKYTDYHARHNTVIHGNRSSYGQQPLISTTPAIGVPTIPALQTQPYGGVTKYTHPGGFPGARPPVVYGSTKYTSPRGHEVSQPPTPGYHGVGMSQSQHAPSHGYYQPSPSQYSAHNLPPYPPQAQSPQAPYQQYPRPPTAAYLQPQQARSISYDQLQPLRYRQPPPPPPPAYYGVNSQQQPHPPAHYGINSQQQPQPPRR